MRFLANLAPILRTPLAHCRPVDRDSVGGGDEHHDHDAHDGEGGGDDEHHDNDDHNMHDADSNGDVYDGGDDDDGVVE